mgnify:CR=1 FL=1
MSGIQVRDDLVIPKGTLIHVNGIPFELRDDTTVIGTQANLDGIGVDSAKAGGCGHTRQLRLQAHERA